MKLRISLIIILFTLFNCVDSNKGLVEETNCDIPDVRIRLINSSNYDFKNIIVNSQSGIKNYGNIDAKKESGYQIFDLAYKYGFVELEIGGKVFTIQPRDYVGETPLEKGVYTYQIDANNSEERYSKLSLTFIEDCKP